MSILHFRRMARADVELDVDVTVPDAPESLRGTITNLSEEGASLIASQSYPIATIVEFNLQWKGAGAPVRVRADVLWSRPVVAGGQPAFAHGLIFTRLDIDGRERLRAFIHGSARY